MLQEASKVPRWKLGPMDPGLFDHEVPLDAAANSCWLRRSNPRDPTCAFLVLLGCGNESLKLDAALAVQTVDVDNRRESAEGAHADGAQPRSACQTCCAGAHVRGRRRPLCPAPHWRQYLHLRPAWSLARPGVASEPGERDALHHSSQGVVCSSAPLEERRDSAFASSFESFVRQRNPRLFRQAQVATMATVSGGFDSLGDSGASSPVLHARPASSLSRRSSGSPVHLVTRRAASTSAGRTFQGGLSHARLRSLRSLASSRNASITELADDCSLAATEIEDSTSFDQVDPIFILFYSRSSPFARGPLTIWAAFAARATPGREPVTLRRV